MKKIFAVIIALTLGAGAIYAATDRHSTNKYDLPKAAQEFINKHFAQSKIVDIEIDSDSYDVKFDKGLQIDFRTNGQWKEVEWKSQGVPKSVIIAPINEYIAEKHADAMITKISRDKYRIDVDLSNNTEIEFNSKGKFIRYDN